MIGSAPFQSSAPQEVSARLGRLNQTEVNCHLLDMVSDSSWLGVVLNGRQCRVGLQDKCFPHQCQRTLTLMTTATLKPSRAALEAGYVHVDCARVYGNEALVGEALAPWIEQHGRSSVFVTSKVWNDAHQPAAARRAIAVSAFLQMI